jgi:hypothetical protein
MLSVLAWATGRHRDEPTKGALHLLDLSAGEGEGKLNL